MDHTTKQYIKFFVWIVFLLTIISVAAKGQTVSTSTTLTDVVVSGTGIEPGQDLPMITVATKSDHSDMVLVNRAKIPAGTVYFGVEFPMDTTIAEVHYWLKSNPAATLSTLGKHTAPPFNANPITISTIGVDYLIVNYWPQLVSAGTGSGTRLEVPFEIVQGGSLPTPGVSRNGNTFHAICGPKALDVVTDVPLTAAVITGIAGANDKVTCILTPVSGGTEVDCARNDVVCFVKTVVP